MPKPVHEHDCRVCTFLGSVEWEGEPYDLYHCKQGMNWPTVIARFSSDPSDYVSGLSEAKVLATQPDMRNHPLVEAHRRGLRRGLIKEKRD